MRVDRLLTLYFSHPVIRLMGRSNALHIPILMYHSISDHIDDHLHPYYRTVTTLERFEQHMRFLSEGRYQVLTLSKAVQLLQKMPSVNSSSPGKSTEPNYQRPMVVITFDDGLRDFYSSAFPILDKFGFKATVFLTSGLINKNFLTACECLREAEIRELATKGVEFGSHTVSHPQLKTLSKNEIVYELAHSKQMIEDIIGCATSLFSYPYRFPEEDKNFTKMLGALLFEHGYSVGVTTIIGITKTIDNPLFLKRLPINDCDDTDFFQAKLAGGYDWLHTAQLAYKKLRVLFRDQDANFAENLSNHRDG
jgi:peptidoglycan/xylan/chitin deacetylase (PgdA/CDA1 family)